MGSHPLLHPTEQTLSAFSLGKLDDSQVEVINNHLQECADCQRVVAEMSSDSFLGRLRGAQGQPSATDSGSQGPIMSDEPGTKPNAGTLPPDLADHPDYQVIRELGRGGMGVVYLAHNRLMGRDEVLKVVSAHLVERKGVIERFSREIRSAARLMHPNIVLAYSAFRSGESIVFAMEYVEGLDLAKLVKTKGPVSVAHASYFVHQAAHGLQHAHEQGMVHRDIKPGNLMLTRKGDKSVVKVLDFGLAKATRESPHEGALTHEGQMLGTPDFIAPEQIRDAQSAGIQADIYSLGCTLYYLLTGGPPFEAASLYDLLQAHFSMDAQPLNLVRPDVPAELAALVAKMMAKDMNRRFQTPAEVAKALSPFFKKASPGAKAPGAEISLASQADPKSNEADANTPSASLEDKPSSTRPSAPRKAAPRAQADPIWNSLLEMEHAEPTRLPASAPAAVKAKSSRPAPPWIWLASAAGILLVGFGVAWQASVKVKTANGIIELSPLPKDAEVAVDGERVDVTWSDGGERAVVTVSPGKHRIKVKKDGFELSGEDVTIESGAKEKLTVRLVPSNPPASPKEPPATVAVSANTKAINDALEMPIPLKYPEGGSLEDVLKGIVQATKASIKSGIPIYVEPRGLQEATKSMTSTVVIDKENIPLRTTLRLLLKDLDLAYVVKGGLVIISSANGIERVANEKPIFVSDNEPSTRRLLNVLERSIPMHYNEETPLENALENIRTDTQREFEYHLDRKGIQEAKTSMTAFVRNLGVEGVPLKTTLRVLLNQRDLDYYVEDGIVIVTSAESVRRRQQGLATLQEAPRNDRSGTAEPAGDVGRVHVQDRAHDAPTIGGTPGQTNGNRVKAANPVERHAASPVVKPGILPAVVVSGTWRVEGPELVQKENGGAIQLGDKELSSYDLKFQGQVMAGNEGFVALFHHKDDANFRFFHVGELAGKRADLGVLYEGKEGTVSKSTLTEKGRWYKVWVKVRGTECWCYLDGQLLLHGVEKRFSKGIICLATWDAIARFRDIVITTPEGKVIWSGLPRLPDK